LILKLKSVGDKNTALLDDLAVDSLASRGLGGYEVSAMDDTAKSVVLVTRAVIVLADDISPWPLGIFTRSSHHVSAPGPPCTD